MGKVRKEKRHKLHLKTPGTSSESRALGKDRDAPPPASLELEGGVVPLPVEIMSSLPMVSLNSEKREKLKRKKDKRKMRREHWLQSM